MEKRLYTIPEAAGQLSVSPATVWRLVRRGELAGVHVGRVLRIRDQDLARYVEELGAPAVGPVPLRRRRVG